MHPIAALMMVQAEEAERRRNLIRRRHRFVRDDDQPESPKRRSWIERIRLLRPGLSST